MSPQIKNTHWFPHKQKNLISGSNNSKHKVVIFSDPLCPYCKTSVPSAIKEMIKHPDVYALYYYHLPLFRIHPLAITLISAGLVAKEHGVKNVEFKLYEVNLKGAKNDKDVLVAFNLLFGTKITLKQLESEKITESLKSDMSVATALIVKGTPAMFIDGKINKYFKSYRSLIKN